MNIRKAIASWLIPPNERTTTYPTLDEVCFGEKSNPNSANSINPDTAFTYVAYWAAIRRISSDLAKLPIHVYRKTPSGLDKQPLHPVQKLLGKRPNKAQTAYIFKETQQSKTLSWGNGYAEIVFDGAGRPSSLRPIDPSRVLPIMQNDGTIVYDVLQPNGRDHVMVPADKMLHTRGLGDGIQGYSVAELFRQNLALALSAESTGGTMFENAFRPGAIISHPGTLTDEAYKRLEKSMNARGSGDNVGKVLITEEGMTFTQWTVPPNDAQFLESRQFAIQDISRMFNIPPHKIGDLSRATFSNVEEQELQYVGDCLQPWLTNWEQELEAKLLLESEQETFKIKFNVDALLRGNSTARSEFHSRMFNIGAVTINEIREKENMQTIGPKGDEHYVPVNLQTAEQAAKPKEDPASMPLKPETDEADDDTDTEA